MGNILVIIPSLQPDEYLLDLVFSLKKNGFTDIAVVDDGSGIMYERLFDKVNKYATVYHHRHNLGKGAAIKTAIQQYPTDTITGYITCDGDGQHSVADIVRIQNQLMLDYDSIILGTRDFSESQVPFRSRFGNRFSSIFFKFRTGLTCPDTQTGLRAFGMKYRDDALAVPGERYEYEMNFLVNAALTHFPIHYMNIETIYNDNNQGSHFHVIRDSYRIYREPVRYIASSLIGATTDVTLFTILVFLLADLSWRILLATVIARICSGLVNFILNKKWSFQSHGHTGIQMAEYFLLFLGIMGLSSLLVSLLAFLPISLTLLKMIVDVALFLISYSVQSKLIFREQTLNKSYGKEICHVQEK